MKNIRPKTIICDIDGTLIEHRPPNVISKNHKAKLLPNTIKKLKEWDSKGYNIILITGRKESLRKATEKQLSCAGIFYDKLIMGVGGGQRILINDLKLDSDEPTAVSINLKRNKGIGKLNF